MTHATRKNVGQRVRALREESNLTQATIDFMEKVALGLGVTLGQLFEGL